MIAAALVALSAIACELALPIHESGDGGDDASPTGNLLQNPGFEQGSIGCGAAWTTQSGSVTIEISDASHSGAQSCFVCATTSSGINQHLKTSFDAGVNFLGSVWVAPGGDAATAEARLFVTFHLLDASPQDYINVSSSGSTAWTQVSKPVTSTGLVTSIDYYVELLGDGGCVLVDDAVLVAQ